MTSPRFEQHRIAFDQLTLEQKKQYIDSLHIQLLGEGDVEAAGFLNECIAKYNAEIYGGYAVASNSAPKPIHAPSLTLSIIGLVFFWGMLTYAGLPCAIIALVMSVKRRHTHNTKAAFVISIIACGIQAVVFTIGFVEGFTQALI